mmetsp:Transcript_95963/g.169640  ORF Transcript_95963/g.169640 Transcript_95963/m.169640 type:complete len:730 (+) Transcript_95963:83-2272(+)
MSMFSSRKRGAEATVGSQDASQFATQEGMSTGTFNMIEQDAKRAFSQGIDFATIANPLNVNTNTKDKAFERPDQASVEADPFLAHTPRVDSTKTVLETAKKAGRNKDVDLSNDVFMAGRFNVPLGMQRLIEVTIIGARGLRDRDGFFHGSSQPYVICEIVNKTKSRFKTPVISNRKEVEWNFTASLPEYVDGDFLKFTVIDKGMISSSEIGEAVLSPDQFMRHGYQGWLSLERPVKEGKDYKFPYLNVSVKFLDAAVDLGADPFMVSLQGLPEDRRGWCGRSCAGCSDSCHTCAWQMRQCCSRMKYWSIVACMQCNVWRIVTGIFCQKLIDVCMGKHSLHAFRGYMVRNCGLESRHHLDIADQDTACCCIPLRTMVFLVSASNFCIACLLLLARRTVEDGNRVLSGGYSLQSLVVNDLVESSGIFFAPFGMVGTVNLEVHHLQTFNNWQIFRLAVWTITYFMDEPLLFHCDLWRTDVKKAVKKYGWNPVMYDIAINQRCNEEFLIFAVLSVLTLLMNMYLVSLTRKLISDVDEQPRYLLRMPADTPDGAFYHYSYSQGKSKPPYAALLGKKAMPPGHMAPPAAGLLQGAHGQAPGGYGQAAGGYGAVPAMVGSPVGIGNRPPGGGRKAYPRQDCVGDEAGCFGGPRAPPSGMRSGSPPPGMMSGVPPPGMISGRPPPPPPAMMSTGPRPPPPGMMSTGPRPPPTGAMPGPPSLPSGSFMPSPYPGGFQY